MRLKRLRIFGFKTFADRTELDVDGGIIAVVGPNGCGKSNLVDAILWGLGEGNPGALRADLSTDVIFNGSAKRKPLGYAEVNLLFDNEDGSMPVPASEVAIGRKITRAGESTYTINRQPCRLKDILDLLADSGLGRSGYAIVGQKEIDQAVSASADERRGWVDEAAGVQRYRTRKGEAQRRLNQAQGHLQRVADILGEVESQRAPLEAEAEVARRYRQVQSSLRDLESGQLVVEVAKGVQDVMAAQERQASATSLAQKEEAEAESLERALHAESVRVSDLDREIQLLQTAIHEAQRRAERAEGLARLGEQRLAALDELEATLGEEAGAAESRRLEALATLAQAEQEHAAEQARRDQVRVEGSGADEEAAVLSKQLDTLEAKLKEARELETRRLRIEAELAQRKQRIRELKRELAGVERTLPELTEAVSEAETAEQEVRGRLDTALAGIKSRQEQLKAAGSEDEHARRQANALASEQAKLEGLRSGIEATLEAHEGLNQGARAVLAAVDAGHLQATYTPVGEAIELEKEVALAIETALGGSVHDLICDDERDARDAIQWLKQHRAGRATFQPIPLMRPTERSADLRRVLDDPAVVGLASELVRSASRHRPVIESLLGRVVIVRDLDTALRLARTSGWNRLVTLDGEVVHSRGSVTGGESGRGQYGMVQRRADLAEVTRKSEQIAREIAKVQREAEKRASGREAMRAEIAQAESAAVGIREELEEARGYTQSLRDELVSTQRQQQKMIAELAQLEGQAADSVEEVDRPALEAERDETLRKLAARSADAEQAKARLEEAESRLRQAAQRLDQARRRLENLEEADRAREKRRTNLEPERQRARLEISQAGSEQAAALEQRAQAQTKLAACEDAKQAAFALSATLAEQIRKARESAQAALETAHQAELQRARAEARKGTAQARLLEEYGITEDEALLKAPEIQLPADAALVVARLRRDLREMGEVNLGAIEAYERLTERANELKAQLDDLHRSIAELEAGIRELDRLTRDRFMATFSALQEAFQGTFQRLFSGGEGALRLTDPGDALNTGIEIDAALPGKRKQKMELLSGGERSLCAIAFLFALLRVKPSPLVVLDEVDAPLDGRNVERFAELLKEFSQEMQFIVVTHNTTTISAAPVWLGVTMQEPGVSQLVPARFADSVVAEIAAN